MGERWSLEKEEVREREGSGESRGPGRPPWEPSRDVRVISSSASRQSKHSILTDTITSSPQAHARTIGALGTWAFGDASAGCCRQHHRMHPRVRYMLRALAARRWRRDSRPLAATTASPRFRSGVATGRGGVAAPNDSAAGGGVIFPPPWDQSPTPIRSQAFFHFSASRKALVKISADCPSVF